MLNFVNTINNMINQLAILTKKVKKVACEVGTEGKLGVQVEVENIQGIWQKIMYVVILPPQTMSLQRTATQTFCQYHGWKCDNASTRFHPDISSGYGW